MSEEWKTKKIDKYLIVNQKLGAGAYGVVYRGFFLEDEKKQVAVKTIPIKETPKMMDLIKREIGILQKIKHPNIVTLFDIARTSNYLYMVLEYCGDGDLKEYIQLKEEGKLSELESVIFIKHIIEGFKKLYRQKIIHRDIKPANILLHNGVAKITDFGFARVIETEMNGIKCNSSFPDPAFLSRVGSPLYMAPQILEGKPFSSKCDIWSVGIIFYEMLYGSTPWSGENAFNLLQNIKTLVHILAVNRRLGQPLQFPSKPVRSQKVKQLVASMLQVNEKDRPPWDMIFEDPTIRIEEAKIKRNMEELLAQKDTSLRSISLNKLYIDQNLVIGYLANNPINSLEQSGDKQETLQEKVNEAQFKSQYDSEMSVRNGYIQLPRGKSS